MILRISSDQESTEQPVPFHFIPHHKHFLTLVGVRKIYIVRKKKNCYKFYKAVATIKMNCNVYMNAK